MSAPTIQTVRAGVTFTPAAAASFRRAEAAWGRRIDVNSTYRNWNVQWSMYVNWNAYVSGDGPYPGHSRAIHPDLSVHCKGLALDSDDWTTPGFITLAAEHGWIRTAVNDPTEQHHFEYQSWRDQHIGELAGGNITIITEEEDSMIYIRHADHHEGTLWVKVDESTGDYEKTTNQATANRWAEWLGPSEKITSTGLTEMYHHLDSRREKHVAAIAAAVGKPSTLAIPTLAQIAKAVNDDAADRLAQ